MRIKKKSLFVKEGVYLLSITMIMLCSDPPQQSACSNDKHYVVYEAARRPDRAALLDSPGRLLWAQLGSHVAADRLLAALGWL